MSCRERRDFPRSPAEWLKKRREQCINEMLEFAKLADDMKHRSIDERCAFNAEYDRKRTGAERHLERLCEFIGGSNDR